MSPRKFAGGGATGRALRSCLCLLFGATRAFGAEYYVSQLGDDSGPGSLDEPFATISHAASAMGAGDVCHVREGVYRETVRPAISGTSDEPIVFDVYPGEHALVTGLDRVEGEWQEEDSGVFSVALDASAVTALFIDSVLAMEARFPDATGEALVGFDWATATDATSTTLRASSLPATELSGAIVHVVSGDAWVSYARRVASYDTSTKTITFDRPIDIEPALIPEAGDAFFVRGARSLLDAPGEWFFDSAAGRLYLMPPGKTAPSELLIERKTRDVAFNLDGLSFVEVRGFSILGASIRAANSTSIVIDDCHFHYPDHLKAHDGYSVQSVGSYLSGEGGQWTNSSVVHAFDSGLSVDGSGHLVENNLFEDVGGSAGNFAGVELRATDVEVRNNTVLASGRYAISFNDTSASVIANNLAERACLLTLDCGLLNTWNTDGAGTRIEHNRLYDNQTHLAAGIYLDDSSTNFIVHHNVISNVAGWGIHIKAKNDLINNTIVDEGGELLVPIMVSESLHGPNEGAPVDLSTSQIKNNLLRSNERVRLRLGQPSITDYAYYEAYVATGAAYTSASVAFADLDQPGWGENKPLTLDAVDQLSFNIESPGDYELEVDNVRLTPSSTLVDDFEDGNANNTFGGQWAGSADPNSTAVFTVVTPGSASSYAGRVTGTLTMGGWHQIQTWFDSARDLSADTGIAFDVRVIVDHQYGTPPLFADTASNVDCPVDSRFAPTTSCAVDAGVIVAGITDGYVGTAPDIGAIESGARAPSVGTTTSDDFVRPEDRGGSGGGTSGTGGEGGSGGGAATGPDEGGAPSGDRGGTGGMLAGRGGQGDETGDSEGDSDDGGCGCRAVGERTNVAFHPSLWLFGFAILVGIRRARKARGP